MHPVRDPSSGAVPASAAGSVVRYVEKAYDAQLTQNIANVMWTGVGAAPMTLIPGSSLLRFRPNIQLDVAEIVYVCEWIAIEFYIIIYSGHDDAKSQACNLYVIYMQLYINYIYEYIYICNLIILHM